MENPSAELDPSLKLALAMAFIHSKRRQNLPPPFPATTSARDDDSRAKSGDNSEPDAIKWKIKVSYSHISLVSILCCVAISSVSAEYF